MAFQKQSGSDAVDIGTQTWNVADGYTKVKILRLLIQLDVDEELALFGKKEEFEGTPQEEIPYKRMEGLNKYIFHLKQLIGNCMFAIEKGLDEMIIQKLVERVDNVEEFVGRIATTITNHVTKETKLYIDERLFKICFNILKNIKDELNYPINRAGLIFRPSEELDLDAIMRDVEQGG